MLGKPFFYIIRHIPSDLYYAGYVMSKGRIKENTFMTEFGYQTSSKVVKNLIKEDGLDSFEIVRVRHFETGKEAFDYEYKFLTKVDAMNNERFLNQSNGKRTFTTLGRKSKMSEKSLAKISRANTGKIWWTDGVNCKWQKESPGENWVRERSKQMKDHLLSISASGDGTLMWNDGIVNKRFKENPGAGWSLGAILTDECRKTIGNLNRGKTWWNNGTDSILSSECPDGWSPGRLSMPNWSECKIGVLSWTNGVINVRAKEKPEGDQWVPGMTKLITNRGKRLWNDGISMVMSDVCPGDGWVLGKITP